MNPKTLLIASLASCLASSNHAFVVQTPLTSASSSSSIVPSSSTSALHVSLTDAISTSSNLLSLVGSTTQDAEVEVLQDMAHVALDMPGLVLPSRSNMLLLRGWAALLGRLFVLGADYLPDHAIRTDELTIQLVLLGVTVREIVLAVSRQQESKNNETAPETSQNSTWF